MGISGGLWLVCGLIFSAGCAQLVPSARQDQAAESSAGSGLKRQARVMSLADEYISSLGEAVYLLNRDGVHDPRARWLAQSFLRNGVGASLDIAAGPNPLVAMLDLLVLASLQVWSFEQHWMPQGIGDGGAPALARLRQAEDELWQSAGSMLATEQLATLRELVDAWIAENPDRTVVALVRFDEFSDERKLSSLALRGKASGLLRDVKQATEAIDDARLLGERVLWLSGRYLYLLGEQAELTAYRIADQPEGRQLLETLQAIEEASRQVQVRLGNLDAERAALFEQLAAERTNAILEAQAALTEVVETSLDDAAARVTSERRAAAGQFFELLAEERSLLLDDLETRQGELGALTSEVREAIEASSRLANELTGTLTVIDRIASRFDSESDEEREPLKLEDVRDVAVETKLAAEELTRLFEATDGLVASDAWDRRIAGIVEPVNAVVDRAFARALALGAILISGFGLVAWMAGRARRRAQ